MNHKQIQRKLILFLDDELTKTEMNEIKQHLKGCSACAKQLEALMDVWRRESEVEIIEFSPFLWTNVAERIKEYETHPHFFSNITEQVVQLTQPARVLLMLIAGILLGVYLGNIPDSSDTQRTEVTIQIQERERYFNSLYLDSILDLPPESLGSVYITLTSDKDGGE